MSDLEKNAWLSFKDIVKIFIANRLASKYTEAVEKLLESYRALVATLVLKYSFCIVILSTFRNIMVMLVTSKVNDFT